VKLIRTLSRLAITGSLLLLPSYSIASAKSPPQIRGGQSCRKAGQLSGTLTASFVCTKVGKKLVWRKVIVSNTTTTSTVSVAPAAPTGLTFAIKTPFDDTGTISWLDNSNNEEFFYISNIDPATLGATPLTSLFGTRASNSTSAGVSKFVNGVTYCYWVMASNRFGNSAWAGPVCSNPALTIMTTTVPVTTVPKSSCPTGQIRIVPTQLYDGYLFYFNVYNETSASVLIDYVRVKFFGSSYGTSINTAIWSQDSVYQLRSGWTDLRRAMSNVISPNGFVYDAAYKWYYNQNDVYQGNKTCSPPTVVLDQSVLASTK
jgi:hypothetical protein